MFIHNYVPILKSNKEFIIIFIQSANGVVYYWLFKFIATIAQMLRRGPLKKERIFIRTV